MVSEPRSRRPDETAQAHAAFLLFRDLGPGRTLAEVARRWRDGGCSSRIRGWARRHEWHSRAQARDDARDAARLDAYAARTGQLAEREAELVRAGLERVAQGFDGAELDNVRSVDLVRSLDVLVRLERELLGADAIPPDTPQQSPEPAPRPPFGRATSVLRQLEAAGVVTLPPWSGGPDPEMDVDEDNK